MKKLISFIVTMQCFMFALHAQTVISPGPASGVNPIPFTPACLNTGTQTVSLGGGLTASFSMTSTQCCACPTSGSIVTPGSVAYGGPGTSALFNSYHTLSYSPSNELQHVVFNSPINKFQFSVAGPFGQPEQFRVDTYLGSTLISQHTFTAPGTGVKNIYNITGTFNRLEFIEIQNISADDELFGDFMFSAGNQAPVAVCQNILRFVDDNCLATVSASEFNNGSSDPNNDPLTFTVSPAGPYPLGGTNVTLTVSDGSLSSTCNAIVQVVDSIRPTINCPQDIVADNDPGVCGALVNYTPPVGIDNCSGANTLQYAGQASGTVFPVGTTTNTFIVTDLHASIAFCSFDVTVTDAENPTITCPQNISVNNDPGQCGALVTYTVNAQDNCQGLSLLDASGSMDGGELPTPAVIQESFPVGVTTKTFSVTDAAGLTATCSFDVTVTDNILPYLECPANIAVDNDPGQCGALVSYTIIANDNCAVQSLSCFCSDDNSPPGGFGSRLYQEFVAVGTITNVFTATDVNGNVSTCSFDITVTDSEEPDAQCKPVTVYLDANGEGSVSVNDINDASTDNCGIRPQCTQPQPPNSACTDGLLLLRYLYGCADVGDNTNVLTVTDIHGNSSTCTATVTVVDGVDPVALCQNVTLTLAGGTVSTTAAAVGNGSSDACGIDNLSLSQSTFDCSHIGANTVTLTVTDVNGNENTCDATVTIIGALPSCSIASVPTSTVFTGGNPNIIYLGYGPQSTRLVATATGGSSFTFSWNGPNLSSYTASSPIFAPTAAGTYTFTVTVTNNFGCVSTCSITICVVDIIVPGSKGKKVFICHVPPGNTANANTLEVAINSVPSHLAHGDYLGRCGTTTACSTPAQPLTNSGTNVQSIQSSGTTTPADVLIGSSNQGTEKLVKEASVRVFPNPFSEQTTISFVSPVADKVKLVVMDPAGNEVSLLYDGPVDAFKDYQFIFNADRTMSSGIYFYRLQRGDGRSYVNKIILTK